MELDTPVSLVTRVNPERLLVGTRPGGGTVWKRLRCAQLEGHTPGSLTSGGLGSLAGSLAWFVAAGSRRRFVSRCNGIRLCSAPRTAAVPGAEALLKTPVGGDDRADDP